MGRPPANYFATFIPLGGVRRVRPVHRGGDHNVEAAKHEQRREEDVAASAASASTSPDGDDAREQLLARWARPRGELDDTEARLGFRKEVDAAVRR